MLSDSWTTGKVARGAGFGRKLGFPTANVELDDPNERPADGIYAAWVNIAPDSEPGSELRLMGAMHVGPRPAIGDDSPTVEIHILDFEGQELYGQRISFQVMKKLRDVENFDSLENLKSAMAADCETTRNYFASS